MVLKHPAQVYSEAYERYISRAQTKNTIAKRLGHSCPTLDKIWESLGHDTSMSFRPGARLREEYHRASIRKIQRIVDTCWDEGEKKR